MIISQIIQWLRKLYNLPHRRRQRHQALMDLAILTEVIDELDGRYLILLNGVPIGPDDGFYPGDRLEIIFIDVPDDEIKSWKRSLDKLDKKYIKFYDSWEDNKDGDDNGDNDENQHKQ